MAQKIQVILEDDLDGSKGDETVRFGLDGVDYEIDLSKKNAKAIRDALAAYIDAGRRVRAARTRRASSGRGRNEAKTIRDWAAANGYEVSSRGRVPAHIREAYEAAN
ncbi:MAG TPA: Lsr2 family protein [Candidatus Avipropionibacterium avicola]|uniref:Lsr2 family protein n=1 Tax=Candidatus Avipropionibacterium avicola TaxID=2840701 RepID=A0A9D1GY39_9ACTN|nr:Lsr2 family protein [Candidatus Avipropionibacterium avicola]